MCIHYPKLIRIYVKQGNIAFDISSDLISVILYEGLLFHPVFVGKVQLIFIGRPFDDVSVICIRREALHQLFRVYLIGSAYDNEHGG